MQLQSTGGSTCVSITASPRVGNTVGHFVSLGAEAMARLTFSRKKKPRRLGRGEGRKEI